MDKFCSFVSLETLTTHNFATPDIIVQNNQKIIISKIQKLPVKFTNHKYQWNNSWPWILELPPAGFSYTGSVGRIYLLSKNSKPIFQRAIKPLFSENLVTKI